MPRRRKHGKSSIPYLECKLNIDEIEEDTPKIKKVCSMKGQ